MYMKLDMFIMGIILILCLHLNISIAQKNANKMLERSKRFAFLKSAGCGVSLIVFFNYIEHFSDLIMNAFIRLSSFVFQYIAAVAIPASTVDRQRLYMAFNFEAHYGLADADTFLSKFKMPVRFEICFFNFLKFIV